MCCVVLLCLLSFLCPCVSSFYFHCLGAVVFCLLLLLFFLGAGGASYWLWCCCVVECVVDGCNCVALLLVCCWYAVRAVFVVAASVLFWILWCCFDGAGVFVVLCGGVCLLFWCFVLCCRGVFVVSVCVVLLSLPLVLVWVFCCVGVCQCCRVVCCVCCCCVVLLCAV